MKALRMEFYKFRRRKIWLAPLLMLVLQLAWGLYSYRNMDAEALTQGWADILYGFPMLNAMMTPVIAAVVASRVADIEHKGQTFKLLETVQSTGVLFDMKFVGAAFYMTLMMLAQGAAIVIFGLIRGFAGPPPWDALGKFLLGNWLVTLTILLIQLLLSLLIQNQMIGMLIGLLGALVGLFSLFFPQSLQKLFVWAYYGVLYVSAMDWDPVTRATDYYFIQFDWIGLAGICIWFALIYLVGRRLFVRKEV